MIYKKVGDKTSINYCLGRCPPSWLLFKLELSTIWVSFHFQEEEDNILMGSFKRTVQCHGA